MFFSPFKYSNVAFADFSFDISLFLLFAFLKKNIAIPVIMTVAMNISIANKKSWTFFGLRRFIIEDDSVSLLAIVCVCWLWLGAD